MTKGQYNKLLITMITGGLSFIVTFFAYAHGTFSTKEVTKKIESRLNRKDKRLNRIENRIDSRLKRIEQKVDKLLGGE